MLENLLFNFFRPVLKVISEIIPDYKSNGAACFDISIISEHALQPQELYNFKTGLKMEIPKGWCLLVFARSSLGQKKCIIPNSVGVIDSDYRGEIKIPVMNLSNETVKFEHGQRIAQGLLIHARQCRIIKAETLSQTLRGDGGFGSTGV